MPTVKVRIAVAVDPEGKWNAFGYSGEEIDADTMVMACEHVADGEARYWLTAELEIPEPQEVVATVERAA